MNLFPYQDKNTIVHRLDPRTKMFILLGSFILSMIHQHPLYTLIITLFIVVHGWISKSLSNLKRICWLLLIIGFSSVVIWSIYAKGATSLFGRISYESFLYGISIALKIDGMIVAGIIFLSTTKNEEVFLGLIHLGIPYPVAFAFSTALRLVPAFVGTGMTTIEAQKSRGLNLSSGNVFVRFKKHIPLLAPIFLTTIPNTNQLAMALESKGFGATKRRTFYFEIGYKRYDFIALIVLGILLFFNIALRFNGYGRIAGLSI